MTFATPTTHFAACGAGEGITRENALDAARLAAGLGNVNLIDTGPVVPPGCRLVDAQPLPTGALVPAILAHFASATPGEVISAGVAMAYPTDESSPAVVMTYAATGHKEDIEAIARRMAEEGLRARGFSLQKIISVAVQHRVEKIGGVVVAVILNE